MKPFHLTPIQPAGYVHAHALDDAVAYLRAMLRTCGERVEVGINRIEPAAVNIVVCAHLLDAAHAALLPADTIIFNSERLVPPTDWPLDSPVYRGLLARLHVWDYSAANLAALGHERASVIPFGDCPELARPIARTPGAALLFYGVQTPHRLQILGELAARGVAVDVVFGEYGEARDRRIAAARAVLNLHKTADARLFEPIRCFYPLVQRCPVVSEPTTDPSAAPFHDAIAWASTTDELARAAGDPDELDRRAARFRGVSARAAIAAAVARFRAM